MERVKEVTCPLWILVLGTSDGSYVDVMDSYYFCFRNRGKCPWIAEAARDEEQNDSPRAHVRRPMKRPMSIKRNEGSRFVPNKPRPGQGRPENLADTLALFQSAAPCFPKSPRRSVKTRCSLSSRGIRFPSKAKYWKNTASRSYTAYCRANEPCEIFCTARLVHFCLVNI